MPAAVTPIRPAPVTPEARLYFGKYRGVVENNRDPELLGRITAVVPDTGSVTPLSWAMPCAAFPIAGTTPLTVPPIGASVWIEFEQGNLDYPIWSGGFWSQGQTPLLQIAGA